MPLDLELLPDKPQTARKGGFSLDLESLPDKPMTYEESVQGGGKLMQSWTGIPAEFWNPENFKPTGNAWEDTKKAGTALLMGLNALYEPIERAIHYPIAGAAHKILQERKPILSSLWEATASLRKLELTPEERFTWFDVFKQYNKDVNRMWGRPEEETHPWDRPIELVGGLAARFLMPDIVSMGKNAIIRAGKATTKEAIATIKAGAGATVEQLDKLTNYLADAKEYASFVKIIRATHAAEEANSIIKAAQQLREHFATSSIGATSFQPATSVAPQIIPGAPAKVGVPSLPSQTIKEVIDKTSQAIKSKVPITPVTPQAGITPAAIRVPGFELPTTPSAPEVKLDVSKLPDQPTPTEGKIGFEEGQIKVFGKRFIDMTDKELFNIRSSGSFKTEAEAKQSLLDLGFKEDEIQVSRYEISQGREGKVIESGWRANINRGKIDTIRERLSTPTEGKIVYHATTKENADKIRQEGITQGMVSDTKADAEEYAQMLRNRGNKNVEVMELKIPQSQLESRGVVETSSGKKIGERFNVLSTPTEQKPKQYVEIKLSDEDKSILEQIKKDIEFAAPGYKYVTRDEITGDVVAAGYEPSDYSYIPYWPKGWSGKPINTIIDNAINKGQLTIKQKEKLDTLVGMYKEATNEQSRLEEELAGEGVSQSEIDDAKRTGEEEAHSAFGTREAVLDAYRKSILPEYNTHKDIISLDALVDKVRELDPKKDDIDYKHGYRYEAKVSYPHSLGENGNQTTFYYKSKPTIKEIQQDILQEYKDFKKDVNEEMVMGIVAKSGRDENIEEKIDKVLATVSNITPSGYAPSVGGKAFAMPPGGLEEWIKRTQEQNVQLKPLEMPELVKLAQELMGKYPIVKKLVTNLGLFKFGKGIALDVKIFKNPQIAGIVLAHEIGHLIDWLPDYTVARGNILGRIATLKYYMKSLLAEKPGMEGMVLTPKDRERLRRVAEQELKAEAKLGEREITEEIIKEIPIYTESKISAEEILSYWRSNETDIRVSNRELYDFIAQLSGIQKLSIIQQALKGIIDERIMKLGGGKRIGTKIVKEQIKRVVTPVEVTSQNISRRFKQLLKEEIIKRKLFSNEVIKEELKRITQWWNPFDDTRKGWFTNYRYGSDELYAEAISVLLNKPEKLEELAPQFYKAFWNYIDRKPEVKKALLELQDFLNMGEGEKLRVRQQDIYSMFKKGEELFYDKRKEYELRKKSIWFRLRTELIDKNTALLDKIKEVEKQGRIINPEDNPKYYLEEYNYIGGKIKNLLGDIDDIVIKPLENQGITQENIGEYLFLNRVVTERADIANPLGQNKETAQRQLEYLHSILGNEKFVLLRQSIDKFQGMMKDLLLEAEKVGLYKPEIIEKLITNPAYATFQVLDYLDDYVAPSIINQIGTLKPIANPFASTILKMISTLRTIERIKTNNSIITFLSSHFPKEITEAKVKHIGKYKAEIVEKEGLDVIKTRENGKLAGYYVDPYIAQSVNASPRNINNAVISVLRFLNSSYFRPVYVNLNLGFQTFNAIRDFTRAWKLNPNVNFPTALSFYWKALPIAKQRIWGNFTNPVIKEMQQSGMMSFTYNNLMRGISEGEETQIEFLLRQYDILKRNPQNPIMKVFNFIEELGDFIETIPKVAGYLSRLKSKTNIKEIAHQVRVFSGSPDFLRKGAGYDWYNNAFLFSNAIKEGIRGDVEGAFKNPKTKSGYWWRTAKINFLPKILALLATLGFFGQKIKENFDKQTEYDKTNYNNIPLGMTEEGKAVYFRLPQDEMGRLLGGIFWKVMSLIKDKELKSVQDIAGLLGGQLPSMSPEIELISSWAQYLTGKNPYDWFRGREILSDDEQMAGGWYSLKPMIGWTAGKLGIYGATIKAQNDETIWEKVIKFTPIVQRFIRITDYGETETEREKRQERIRANAIRKLEKRGLR